MRAIEIDRAALPLKAARAEQPDEENGRPNKDERREAEGEKYALCRVPPEEEESTLPLLTEEDLSRCHEHQEGDYEIDAVPCNH